MGEVRGEAEGETPELELDDMWKFTGQEGPGGAKGVMDRDAQWGQRYDIAYMWNLKRNDTNELIYKTEIDPQI